MRLLAGQDSRHIFAEREGSWKSYFKFHLKNGGTFLLNRLKCNYDVKDLNLRLYGFYLQLPAARFWWAAFRNVFEHKLFAL